MLVTLPLLAPGARAQGGFVVRDVAVEASAATPIAAREAAHLQGFREAWRRLLESEAPDRAAALAALPDAELARLVEGFEVAEERVTATRYGATMTVIFRPDPVRALLAGGAAPARIEARAAFVSLAEWTEIRRRLAGSPAVSRVELLGLSSAEARLGLTFTAGIERAVASLAAAGLALTQGPDGWRLALGAP
ncbi:hypothetical protein [Elioraea sp. Yellowstone]|jgi:hypothetical protein|uniref:hypothetical protein n=1 Tax=Elioraea sp. Yellowstone TaxID=2592070 RepID=UPI00192A24AB|nr:hypothetical protein [Elioraea sp. Yellowstone]